MKHTKKHRNAQQALRAQHRLPQPARGPDGFVLPDALLPPHQQGQQYPEPALLHRRLRGKQPHPPKAEPARRLRGKQHRPLTLPPLLHEPAANAADVGAGVGSHPTPSTAPLPASSSSGPSGRPTEVPEPPEPHPAPRRARARRDCITSRAKGSSSVETPQGGWPSEAGRALLEQLIEKNPVDEVRMGQRCRCKTCSQCFRCREYGYCFGGFWQDLGCGTCAGCKTCRSNWTYRISSSGLPEWFQTLVTRSQMSGLPAPNQPPTVPPHICPYCRQVFDNDPKGKLKQYTHRKVCPQMPYDMWLTRTRTVTRTNIRDHPCAHCGTHYANAHG